MYAPFLTVADSLAELGNYSEAESILYKAMALAKEWDDQRGLAMLSNKTGSYLSLDGKEIKAMVFFRNAIRIAALVADSLILSDALNNLGIAHGYTRHPDSAFYYYERSLQIREKLNDTTRLSASYRNMAEILRVLRRMEEATFYCRKAYQLIPGIDDYKIIANIYNELAYLYELSNRLDSARYFYLQLIDISKENGFVRGVSVGYSNLASVYEKERNFSKALELKKLGLGIDRETGYIYGVMTSYRAIANCYFQMAEPSKALAYLDSADAICDSTWLSDLMGNADLKYRVFRSMGKHKQALVHLERSMGLKDSLFNEQKRKNIAEILTKYETEKKEQQIELLDKTNQLNSERIRIQWIILSAVLLISIAGGAISMLIIKNKNHRLEQMSLELKNYLLQWNNLRGTNPNQQDQPVHHESLLIDQFGLTQREAEIMELISQGLTNQELGAKLFISSNTIKYHIKNIYIKLDVKNRVQALQKTTSSQNHLTN